MTDDPIIGSRVIVLAPEAVLWAVDELCGALTADQIGALKISSGEHLAAILTTAVLGCPPVTVDERGGPDLSFDLVRQDSSQPRPVELPGHRLAGFEVKSLPGGFRKYDAGAGKAFVAGQPDEVGFGAIVRSADDVFRTEGSAMIAKATEQLERKAGPEHSMNVFLIAHLLDHPYVEMFSPLLASALSPLSDVDGIDSVWLLWAPGPLVVWTAASQTWTDILYDSISPESSEDRPDLEYLQQVEQLFFERSGYRGESPYLFGLTHDDGGDQAS